MMTLKQEQNKNRKKNEPKKIKIKSIIIITKDFFKKKPISNKIKLINKARKIK